MFRSSFAMLKSSLVLLSALALTAVSLNAQRPSPGDHPDVQGAIRLFSAWMGGQVAGRGLPGVVVGVVADQELVWAEGFGFADIAAKRPMRSDTRFRMASHSKLFTATAIMQLREQGKIQLYDPVSEYLPWFQVRSAELDDPPITIEHLLSHASGLQREAGPHWTTREFPTQEELRNLMPERQAAFSPEVRYKYSNLAFSIAGMVVEVVSGQGWADYLQTNIFDPLGMSSSSVDLEVESLATGYTLRKPDGSRDAIPFVDARGMASATGLTSTVEDMAKFVSAQFRKGGRGDGRILSTASLREMHRVRMLENDWTNGHGIGFWVQRLDGTLYVEHGGGYPGYSTNTTIQLDSKVGAIVLTNSNDSNSAQMAEQLMSTVGVAVAEATKVVPDEVAWDPSWARFAGLYRRPGGSDSQVVLLNERLVIINPRARNLDNLIRLEPLGDGVFLYTASGGDGVVGEQVHFLEQNGEVVRMFTGDSFVDRIPTIDTPHRLVFQSEVGGGIDVWMMNADGSDARNLTNNGSFNDRHPTGSSDGTRIAFRSDRDGNADVWVMDADGTNQRNLTFDGATDIDPSFSPDGSRITFDTNRDGNDEIYVMNADGSNVVRLTDNEVHDSHPFWSPDGEDIAFYSDRDNPGDEAMDIYVMAADGSNVRRLTDHPADDRYPSWSPGGDRLTFSSDRDGDGEIWVMNADGSNPVQLTTNAAPDFAPVWSPDGEWIVFASERDGQSEIYLIGVDGTRETRLTSNDTADGNPRWLAGGGADR